MFKIKQILIISSLLLFGCIKNRANIFENTSEEIIAKIHSIESEEEIEIMLKSNLMIINGGEPPKFFKQYGLVINSSYEKDIVIIEFTKSDTIGVKLPFSNLLGVEKVYLENTSNMHKDDIIILERLTDGNIVISKK